MSSFRFILLKLILLFVALVVLCAIPVKGAYAFTNISDTITTSRPSASSPLNANAASGDTQLTIFSNKSYYLASDSARIIRKSTGASIANNLPIASQSGGLTTVFLGSPNTVGAAASAGTDVLMVPITAMHTVDFKSSFQLNNGETWVLTFPLLASGDSNNPASPSASTFQLNGMSSTNIHVWDATAASSADSSFSSITITNPSAGTSPVVTLTANTTLTAGHEYKIFLGCTTVAAGACTVQNPAVINPTKSAAAGTGDTWKVQLSQTGTGPDSATFAIATVESVTVRATVDPTLTITIAGIANGGLLSAGNAGCSLSSTNNSGITANATDVNLGIVSQTPNTTGGNIPNISGQLLTITTNGPNGYALTATASSSLLKPDTGFFFNANTTPTSFPGTGGLAGHYHYFGLHPCGQEVNTSWVNGGGAGSSDCTMQTGATGSNCLFAWPSTNAQPSASPITIASNSVGPIGTGNGNTGLVSVAYAAGTDVSVPPGSYRTVITYVATPTF